MKVHSICVTALCLAAVGCIEDGDDGATGTGGGRDASILVGGALGEGGHIGSGGDGEGGQGGATGGIIMESDGTAVGGMVEADAGLEPDAAPCVPVDGPDEPDAESLDSNCDGIDGDAALAVFVALDGDDAGLGERDAPVATLARALEVAATKRSTQVILSGGEYAVAETVVLVQGIGLHGGYDRASGWRRADVTTVLRGPQLVLRAQGLVQRTALSRLTAISADAVEPGGASVVLFSQGSEGLALYDGVRLEAGRGADGMPGVPGVNGGNGLVGGSGTAGSLDDEFDNGDGGPGGVNALCPMANGGNGGSGGRSDRFSADSGQGSPGGASGGSGGSTGGCSPSRGSDGSGGNPRPPGFDGQSGIATGAFEGLTVDGLFTLVYYPAHGVQGFDGQHGQGGGGGGGSSGQGGVACIDGAGNGGGGGGAGGCAGTGGGGGGGGGASVAVVMIGGAISLDGVELVTSGGGAGAAGAAGGTGWLGSEGGDGSDYASGEVGIAGDGGDGGPGAPGGNGGGGGGGPSFGVYAAGGEPMLGSTSFTLGSGGAAGMGPVPGLAGLAEEVHRL